MSEPTPSAPVNTQPTPANTTTAKPRGSALAKFNLLLILLLLAAMAAVLWYGYPQYQQLQAQRLALQHQQERQSDELQAQQAYQQQAQRRFAKLEQQQQELAQVLEQTNATLAAIPTAGRQDWLLAEAEYLLRLANQRLQLENDWNSALSMLQAADNVLVEAQNPRMNSVRALLAEEMLALRKAPNLDLQGAILRLQALQHDLPRLPWVPKQLKLELPAAEPLTSENQELAWYQIFWEKISTTLVSLVRIRVQEEGRLQPISPDQQYYLEQTMFLMLEQAQAALLREEPALYQHSLQRVSEWVTTYLVNKDAATEAVLQSLQELLQWPVAPARPDIGGSLLKLQQLLEQQQRSSVNAREEDK